jgi:hypothetical protein
LAEESVWWPVPSGTTVRIELGPEQRVPNTAFVGFTGTVFSTGAEKREIHVVFDDPGIVNVARRGNNLPALDSESRAKLAKAAALHATAQTAEFFQQAGPLEIPLNYDGIRAVEQPPALDDRGIRHYLARRFYLAWREEGFDRLVVFADEDLALTGTNYFGLLRNPKCWSRSNTSRSTEPWATTSPACAASVQRS